MWNLRWGRSFAAALLSLALLTACATPQPAVTTDGVDAPADGKLRVVATTNVVADVVARIGGDVIDLTALMGPGVDPHGYQLTPGDRRLLEDADLIFINGLGLEEGVLPFLNDLDSGAPVIEVNANVELREFDLHAGEEHADEEHAGEEHAGEEHADEEHADEEHAHDGDDPHTWFSVPAVMVWTETIAATLSDLDPVNAEAYAAAAEAYRTELAALDAEIRDLVATLPAERRKLVTDHDSFGYYAHEYGFDVIGAVIPGLSTMAAPAAQDLARLQDQIVALGVPAIFVGTTVNPSLAERIAQDLDVQVVTIYHGALSDADGPASTYIDMMRHNTQAIVAALQ